MTASFKSEQADSTADDYQERVLRNEGELNGLKVLVSETREADRKLIEQRSESLARELERRADAVIELLTARADAVLALSKEEREADRRHVETLAAEANKQLALLREMYDDKINENYKQSRESIIGLEQRGVAETVKLEQMVQQWRESDKEARELFAAETVRHLDTLNHNNERMAQFQANSVTRELWQADKDAAIHREGVLRDQIIAIDRALLATSPTVTMDKVHAEMMTRMETTVTAATAVLDNKIETISEKVADLKSYRDSTQGRSVGYTSLYGWGVAAVGLVISVIVLANALLGQ